MIVDIRLDDVQSSNVKRIHYQAERVNDYNKDISDIKGTLTITYFNDAMYNYLDIPMYVIGNILMRSSIGSSMAIIKKEFESERVGQ
jgi:hypothetical protein